MSATNVPGAATNATSAEDLNKAKADAAAAERARISGIQSCEEAKGREALASHLALNTSMSVDEAKGILSASPKATAAAPSGNAFREAMDKTGNPNVGADAAAGEGENGQPSRVAALLQTAAMVGVRGFDKAERKH